MANKIIYIRKILELPESKAFTQEEVDELTDKEILILKVILANWANKIGEEDKLRSERRKLSRELPCEINDELS